MVTIWADTLCGARYPGQPLGEGSRDAVSRNWGSILLRFLHKHWYWWGLENYQPYRPKFLISPSNQIPQNELKMLLHWYSHSCRMGIGLGSLQEGRHRQGTLHKPYIPGIDP